MILLHTVFLYLHIALGALALVVYWLPITTKKGGSLHIQAGKLFYYLMLFVAASGMIMSVISLYDPISIYINGRQLSSAQINSFLAWRIPFSHFLLLLSLLTWVTVRHAVAVLQVKDNRLRLRGIRFQGPVFLLFPYALYVLYQGLNIGMPLLTIFAIVSMISAITISLYVYKTTVSPRAWIIEHFSSMVGSGVAVYTAFFAAGGRRLLTQWLPGDWQLLTWLLAPSLGVMALLLFTAYFKKKYRVTI